MAAIVLLDTLDKFLCLPREQSTVEFNSNLVDLQNMGRRDCSS